ncbi:MAG: PQQ-dependent sugar dehydrogenase, partial [Myxococcales bacterium]|nr:PQQ-dependent sugar dehydrogenase [Myxococcales bacterium]
YGLRNPWKIAFDAQGRLWAGDVGQDIYEEVNIIERGGNYGWVHREGPACYLGDPTECANPDLIGPIAWYDHANGGNSITGGHVYRGSVEDLRGAYVFADFVSHRVWALWEDGPHGVPADPDVTAIAGHAVEQLFTTDELIDSESLFVPTFLEDTAGELYVVVAGNEFGFNESVGEIYRFDPPEDASLGDFPTTLSATGCFDVNPWTGAYSVPSEELLPYTLNAPFWSDGATKERFVALPSAAGDARMRARISSGDGDIDFPIGTVLIKEFMLDGRRIETRFMIRHDDGVWGGYTYRWREDQRDADLLRTDLDESLGDVTWHYPSLAECLQCHGLTAGRALGPEMRQLDRSGTYWRGRSGSELETWAYLGLVPWTRDALGELARFRLDEGQGNVVQDALGDVPSPTVLGNATWTASTIGDQVVSALTFDGTTYLDTGVPSGAARTLSAYIYPTASADVPFVESVFDADVPGEYGTGFGLDDGTIKVLLDDAFWETGVPITIGQWQHVALSLDAGMATLYVNGVLAATHAYVAGEAGEATYFIGKSRANAAFFHGRIFDARIFDEALDAAAIAGLYAGIVPEAEALAPYPELVTNVGSVTDRARAWIHTNCASCHRPGGNGQGGLDLRFDTAFEDTFLCNTVPQYGNAGIGAPL